jgi:hypothetical protein
LLALSLARSAAHGAQLALPVIGVLGSGSRNAFEFALSAFVEGVAQV